jgi:hypothetical protein
MKKILFLLFFVISGLMIADDHKRMPADRQDLMWMAKLKMDLAELKGPPSLAELKTKRENRLANLDLLIDSGKYKGNALERLISMRNRVLETNLPSQDQINQRHDRRLSMMKSKMRSRVKMMDRKFRDPRRERDMLERERREMRKQRNKNRNKD